MMTARPKRRRIESRQSKISKERYLAFQEQRDEALMLEGMERGGVRHLSRRPRALHHHRSLLKQKRPGGISARPLPTSAYFETGSTRSLGALTLHATTGEQARVLRANALPLGLKPSSENKKVRKSPGPVAFMLAEEEGFEPSSPGLRVKRFSRPPHSTTLPPLRRMTWHLPCAVVHSNRFDRIGQAFHVKHNARRRRR